MELPNRMTTTTPVYAIPYLEQGTPARLLRATQEAQAKAVEAALLGKALAPPGATDYATLQARMAALYKVAPLGPTIVAAAGSGGGLTFDANWAHFDATGFEAVRISKDAQGLVTLTGLAKNVAATSANQRALFLPAAYRPRTTALVALNRGDPITAVRADVLPSGEVWVFGAQAANSFWNMECSWRSADSNTSTTS